jgi:hypothetical protein
MGRKEYEWRQNNTAKMVKGDCVVSHSKTHHIHWNRMNDFNLALYPPADSLHLSSLIPLYTNMVMSKVESLIMSNYMSLINISNFLSCTLHTFLLLHLRRRLHNLGSLMFVKASKSSFHHFLVYLIHYTYQ